MERLPSTVLLEQASGGAGGPGRWSQLFLSPLRTLAAFRLQELSSLFHELERATASGRIAAGYFTYECGRFFEPACGQLSPFPGEPLAWFGIYPRSYPFDPQAGCFLDGEPPEFAAMPGSGDAERESELVATLPLAFEPYAASIAQIHNWIRAGDLYQLNFTLPLKVETSGVWAALYRRLLRRQPAAHSAFVHGRPGHRILSFSPELFFRLEGPAERRRIETRPMKGTARRGVSTTADRAQAEWLRHDEKNRAENLMIVDLLRNDLGRIARVGSVRVSNLFAVERHPTLWQMTSTVSAELPSSARLEQIFGALFPSGSITGAPKIRAMQRIAELEASPRGVYTGAIGYIAPDRAEFNVAIRTLEFPSGLNTGRMGVGGGIVIDSTPASEYAECRLKASFLTETPPEFELIETLLWRGNYPRLELHLERLVDSAGYFDFACDRAWVVAALAEHVRLFPAAEPRRVRLLLARDGRLSVTSSALPSSSPVSGPARVALASERTDPDDPFYFHKTTHRPLYDRAYARARSLGLDDLLFFNRRGELTEGAISNVFVQIDGRWATPPLACGLLAGVERRRLLAERPEIEERPLTEADLRRADALWLTNAVRGLRRAQLCC